MIRRWFWRIYWLATAVAVLVTAGRAAGPMVEARFWPIRASQQVHDVTRAGGRLCWTSEGDKLRAALSDNVDVFLDTADGDRSYPEVFDPATGRPWHRLGMLPIGHYRRAYCLQLPARVGPADPVTVRLVAHYRGWLGLWTVMVPMPDVIDRPEAPTPK